MALPVNERDVFYLLSADETLCPRAKTDSCVLCLDSAFNLSKKTPYSCTVIAVIAVIGRRCRCWPLLSRSLMCLTVHMPVRALMSEASLHKSWQHQLRPCCTPVGSRSCRMPMHCTC